MNDKVWTVIGFWYGSRIVVTGVIEGRHDVHGGDVSNFSEEGLWAQSFTAPTPEAAEALAAQVRDGDDEGDDDE